MRDVVALYGWSWRSVRAGLCWYVIEPLARGAREGSLRGRVYWWSLPHVGDFAYAPDTLALLAATDE